MVQKEGKRARGRPRAYDPGSALARATEAFWLSGYSGTSLDALSESTGMNRPSLYSAFGDKRALYLATLDHYTSASRARIRELLAPDRPLADVLRDLYRRAISFYVPAEGAPRGCLLISTAATESMSDPQIRGRLGDALQQFDDIFAARLRHAQSVGELDSRVDPSALAKIASAVLHTLAVRSRAGDSRASLQKIADLGVTMICDWNVDQRRKPPSRRRKRSRTESR